MKYFSLAFVVVAAAGCCKEPTAKPLSPQEVYIQEATVLEHLQNEYDRIIRERNEEEKRIALFRKEVQYQEKAGNKAEAETAQKAVDLSTKNFQEANQRLLSKVPPIARQEVRVDDAKKELGLIE